MKFKREGVISLETPQWKRVSSRFKGRISWFFSSGGRNLGVPLDLQWGPQESTCVTSGKSSLNASCEGPFGIPLQSVKGPMSTSRVEALFCCGIKRYIQPSLLSLERVLDTLEATQEVPDISLFTREEHQGSHHNSRRAPFFPPHLEMRVPFPASSGKESHQSRRTSRGGGLNLKVERNSRVVPPFQKTPMPKSTPDTPDSPALTRLSPRVLSPNG